MNSHLKHLIRPLPGSYAEWVRSEASDLGEHVLHVDADARLCGHAERVLERSGLMEALRPVEWGGQAADPVDFFAGVIELSSALPSLGWVAGVMGVHQFEVAVAGHEVARAVWGSDRGRGWVATPYAERGTAYPDGNGFLLSGTWEYSTGFSLADWLCIGGRIHAPDGSSVGRVFTVPKSEAHAKDDSWNVLGLRGTGSLTFSVPKTFVKDSLVYDPSAAIEGQTSLGSSYSGSVFRMPRQSMLGSAISAATIGAGLGYLRWFAENNGKRLKGTSRKPAVEDPTILSNLSCAAADCESAVDTLLVGLRYIHDASAGGDDLSYSERLRFKRNCVNAVHRLGESLGRLFAMSGGAGLQETSIGQCLWRDFVAGRNHNSHVYEWLLRYGRDYYGIEYTGSVV